MVIVVVKNFGGTSEVSGGMQERKRSRAAPPEGWIGESKVVKKRQVGERAEILKNKLDQFHPDSIDTQKMEVKENGIISGASGIISPCERRTPIEKKRETQVRPSIVVSELSGEKSMFTKNAGMEESRMDFQETINKLKDQIRQVQELPPIVVPKMLSLRDTKITSASSPDLSLYSSSNIRKSHFESSWEIRQRYRNMRTEELCQNQLTKVRSYSWRDKVPEIQSLKFSEFRSSVVTDVSFVGSSYVTNIPDVKTTLQRRDKNKTYTLSSSLDISKIRVVDRHNGPTNHDQLQQEEIRTKLQDLSPNICNGKTVMEKHACRLLQLLNFPRLNWQLMLTYPGFDYLAGIKNRIDADCKNSSIMEVDEKPELKNVNPGDSQDKMQMQKTAEGEKEIENEEEKEDINTGDIKRKIFGSIAGMKLIKKRIPGVPSPSKVEVQAVVTPVGSDWRTELKKRERSKQLEQLNAMPLGMPDYKEPEKGPVLDWRTKLKTEEDNQDVRNKWTKLDTGLAQRARLQPTKTKKKQVETPKEDPCTCNLGKCKVHFKFALKTTAKKQELGKTDVPSKTAKAVKTNDSSSVKAVKSSKTIDPPQKREKKQDTVESDRKEEIQKCEEQLKNKSLVKRETAGQHLENNTQSDLQTKEKGSKVGKIMGEKTLVKPSSNNMVRKPSVRDGMEGITINSAGQKEVVRIINFVAIKVPVDDSPTERKRIFRKKSDENKIKPPPPTKPPPPPPEEDSPPPTSPPVRTPSPIPAPPTPPPAPPQRQPTPPPQEPPSPSPQLKKKELPCPPSPTTSSQEIKQNKYHNYVGSKAYKPKELEFNHTGVRIKRHEEEPEKIVQRQPAEVKVKPLNFTAEQGNCVTENLFIGNQYVGNHRETERDSKNFGRYRAGRVDVGKVEVRGTVLLDINHNCDTKEMKRNTEDEGVKSDGCDKKLGFVKNKVFSLNEEREGLVRDGDSMNDSGKNITNISQMRNGSSWRDRFKDDSKNEKEERQKVTRKTKASTMIIDILTAKKLKDEVVVDPSLHTPMSPRKKLSDYVCEVLRQEGGSRSTSRSITPTSYHRPNGESFLRKC